MVPSIILIITVATIRSVIITTIISIVFQRFSDAAVDRKSRR